MTAAGPALRPAYADALCKHAHWMIAEGYERLEIATFERAQEPAITGELVQAMRGFLESGESAPSWVTLYSLHDDPPIEAGGRRGRSRLRVDIEFERIAAGRRPRLRFEAKRLCSDTRHTVAGYLGKDGLGCFLTGRYPTTHGEAGMLGYVQSGGESAWAEKIAVRLSEAKAEHGSLPPPFTHQQVHAGLRHTYASHHQDRRGKGRLVIHHVLLRFGAGRGTGR